jgi:hypothetical protein
MAGPLICLLVAAFIIAAWAILSRFVSDTEDEPGMSGGGANYADTFDID